MKWTSSSDKLTENYCLALQFSAKLYGVFHLFVIVCAHQTLIFWFTFTAFIYWFQKQQTPVLSEKALKTQHGSLSSTKQETDEISN